MTLLERATQAEAKLSSLRNLDQQREEVVKLEERHAELDRELKGLQSAVALISEYRAAKLSVPVDRNIIQKLRVRIVSVASEFSASPRAETLTAARRWSHLLGATAKVTEECNLVGRTAWSTFLERECVSDPPDAFEEKLAPTTENQGALQRYKEAYRVLRERTHRQARLATDIETVKAALTQLRKAQATFNFAYPADVTAFLKAAQGLSGASLTLLTQNVLTWLDEHRMLGQFSVRPRT